MNDTSTPDAAPAAAAPPPARRSFLKDLFSERDNQTWDLKRVLWAIGFAWALGLETYTIVCLHKEFDIVTFALGLSGLLAAGGGVLALNRKAENGAPQ